MFNHQVANCSTSVHVCEPSLHETGGRTPVVEVVCSFLTKVKDLAGLDLGPSLTIHSNCPIGIKEK